MELISVKNGTKAVDFGEINLPITLNCGQAFRWECIGDSIFRGVAFGKETKIKKEPDGLLFIDTPIEDVKEIWADYFDLYAPYEDIVKRLCEDDFIRSTFETFGYIRILNQQPWETLCSFIISACNNIPRIQGIVKRLCEAYGEPTGDSFTFPAAETLAVKTEEELSFLRAGYRVPYILDAARRVASGEIDFTYIRSLSEEEARKELMKIRGVGRKVADCTLLFSLGFRDCFPVDRHIARAAKALYPDGLPECFKPDSGLAQQYIFYHMLDI